MFFRSIQGFFAGIKKRLKRRFSFLKAITLASINRLGTLYRFYVKPKLHFFVLTNNQYVKHTMTIEDTAKAGKVVLSISIPMSKACSSDINGPACIPKDQ
ncbi:hypothetical protein PBPRB0092 [Photobacterium profundum SS9]|uniref:Uncharacterized protein n=1 Tax=Photobacterium profundum (strain SS9) TaxID=298386 RepID=Q6LLE6_PHOPR|nr:hypothetical protein PBPRB0092 [Photobacterium profundum SS9]